MRKLRQVVLGILATSMLFGGLLVMTAGANETTEVSVNQVIPRIPNRAWYEIRVPFTHATNIEFRVTSQHNAREHRAVGHIGRTEVFSPWTAALRQSVSGWVWGASFEGRGVLLAER